MRGDVGQEKAKAIFLQLRVMLAHQRDALAISWEARLWGQALGPLKYSSKQYAHPESEADCASEGEGDVAPNRSTLVTLRVIATFRWAVAT